MRTPANLVGAVVLVLLSAACGSAGGAAGPAAAPGAIDPSDLAAAARADSVRQHYTAADVAFVTGMIHHHAQALVMARMAPSHDASPPLQTLAARIINGQNDEIWLMQQWLRERGEPVPEVDDDGAVSAPGGTAHAAPAAHAAHGADAAQAAHAGHAEDAVPMTGMLTPEQLARLGAARGAEWDRLFLTYMIQHHQGAVDMVKALFRQHGAGQGDALFKLASDVAADQSSEIDRMQRMLRDLVFAPGSSP